MQPTVRMLGTHGIPAAYGGFETAAENVGKYLVRQGWRVIVYCQVPGRGPITEDVWEGMERVNIPIDLPSWRGTWKFDHLSISHACQFNDLCLTFGYNTAIYNIRQRLKKIPNIINMDGIEWSRKRWNFLMKAILYINERVGCIVGNALIADHPVIESYLSTRISSKKITTIAYGADPVDDAPIGPITAMGLEPGTYFTIIARPVPENSILEMIQAYSRAPRGRKLVVLGEYSENDDYQRRVRAAASSEVLFPGAIYKAERVQALRFHSIAYFHGHTVGGTNPSLVEALAAHNPVIAHDNPYNRWVAGDAALYFTKPEDFAIRLDELLRNPNILESLKSAARVRFQEAFTWDHIASQYEHLLLKYIN